MDEQVDEFVSFTAASEAVARGFLQMSGGDVMQAVQLFYEHPELQSSVGAEPSSSSRPAPGRVPASASATPASIPGANRTNAIAIDSDDDDAQMLGSDLDDDGDNDDGDTEHIDAIRRAQEEEDARLAQQMQEDLYKQVPADEDGVRAPIARTTETLVAPTYGGPSDLAFDDEVDGQSRGGVAEMERRRRNFMQQQRRCSWLPCAPPGPKTDNCRQLVF